MESHDRIAALLSWYRNAPEDVKHEGRGWYDAQREMVRELAALHGIDVETIAAVIAALSPMTRWTENVAGAIRMLREFERDPNGLAPRGCTLFWKNAAKAWWLLHGHNGLGGPMTPAQAFAQSPKVFAFWRNLIGDENEVTVDTWMLRAMGVGERFGNGLKPKPYRELAQDIRDAARRVGETPAQFQAIVWVAIRRQMAWFDTTKEAA